jgi:hypothetical protein
MQGSSDPADQPDAHADRAGSDQRHESGGGSGGAPRYEFRVFGGDLAGARARLSELASPEPEETREDAYLVVKGRTDSGLKLRGSGGTLDLKCLVRVEEGCELWKPEAKAKLPLTGSEISRRFLKPAGIPEILTAWESFDGPELLEALANVEGVRALRIGKSRRQYLLGEDIGELGEFVFPDAHREDGIALESADLRRLRGLVDTIGLHDRSNVSLPRRLEAFAFGETRKPG